MKHTFRLVPLLLLYIVVVLLAAPAGLASDDETLYAFFADNLTHGIYSPTDNVNLWFGPGYPAVLALFDALGLPWIAARLLNAVLLFAAVRYFHAALRLYLPERPALVAAILLGLYVPFLTLVHRLYSESLVVFLITGFVYHYCRWLRPGASRPTAHMLLAAGYLAYLALTKIFFGYVLLAGVILFGLLYGLTRQRDAVKSLLLAVLALLFCTPYLGYTYRLTDQVFYWANSGGMSLYWMSSPYPNDLGDWHAVTDFDSDKFVDVNHEMTAHHGSFFDEVMTLPGVERDRAFRDQALDNIRQHPGKYAQNWLANVGRLLFNYPYSYTTQRLSTYLYIAPNLFLVAVAVFSLYPSLVARRLIPFEIAALLAFAVLALLGSSLLSAYYRQFLPVVPILVMWIAFVWTCLVRIEIRRDAPASRQ